MSEAGFYDYIHKLSRTPIPQAQHPDYEICQMGIHGQRGVSCADLDFLCRIRVKVV